MVKSKQESKENNYQEKAELLELKMPFSQVEKHKEWNRNRFVKIITPDVPPNDVKIKQR